MTPQLRKLVLTAHVTSSVGWLGAVAGFLALALAGLTSEDNQMVRAAYLAMELTCWFVIVPLSLASPLTGVVQSLGTTWGLFRHYWVLTKLLMTIPASIVLLLHVPSISRIGDVVAVTTLSSADLSGLRIQLVANAGAAMLVLLIATTLSVYKPRGMTAYGRLHQHDLIDTGVEAARGLISSTPRWVYAFGIAVIVLIVLFLIQHLTGGGFGGHTK